VPLTITFARAALDCVHALMVGGVAQVDRIEGGPGRKLQAVAALAWQPAATKGLWQSRGSLYMARGNCGSSRAHPQYVIIESSCGQAQLTGFVLRARLSLWAALSRPVPLRSEL